MIRNCVWTVGCLALLVSSCEDSKSKAPTKESGRPAEAPGAPVKAPAAKKTAPPSKAPAATKEKAMTDANPVVVMETSKGTITIELNEAKAPITVENFLKYVDDGFYGGTVFHRVIPTFMIQGGGFTPDLKQKPTRPPIKNEAKNGLKNVRGSIAMARTPDPHSASAQFFINVRDNRPLDYPAHDRWGYAVFGKVIDGMDVVDKIRNVRTGARGPFDEDCPLEDVIIRSVKRQ